MALDVGAYQPLSTARSAPAFSMSSRQKQARTTNIDSPGPAAYTAVSSVGRQVSAALPTQPRTKVGTGPQRVDHSRFWRDNPGPGTYNVPTTVGKVPGATMKSRTYVRPLYTTPSPADYKEESGMGKQVLRRSNPSYSMAGRQPRPHTTDMDAPAPDAYNLEPRSKAYNPLSTQRSNPAFSLRGRKPTVVNQWDSQGPGQCRTDSAFGKQVDGKQRSNPRYTFGYRTGGSSLYQDTGVPGPGTYSHDRPSTAPGATLTSRVRRPVPKVTPAPGDYAEDRATGKQVGSTRRTMPAYTFGTETGRKKGMAKRDGVPGPGEYGNPLALGNSKKGATMRSRQKFGSAVFFDPAIPGPGAYNDQSRMRSKSASGQRFMKGQRSIKYDTLAPGPGAYTPQFVRKAPEFTLGSRKFVPYKSADTTGPGVCREDSGFGKQVTSTQKSNSGFSFGSRTPMRIEDPTPGPGAYGHFSRGVRGVPKRKLNLKGKAKGTRRRQREAAERQTQKKRVAHYV